MPDLPEDAACRAICRAAMPSPASNPLGRLACAAARIRSSKEGCSSGRWLFSWPLSCSCGGDGASSSAGASGIWRARGASTSLAASAASSRVTSARPASAALARAQRSAKIGARRDSTPSAKAAAQKASGKSAGMLTRGKSWRAAIISARLVIVGGACLGSKTAQEIRKAKRSDSASATCSSSVAPSSSAITPRLTCWEKVMPSRATRSAA